MRHTTTLACCASRRGDRWKRNTPQHTATHCTSLQHTTHVTLADYTSPHSPAAGHELATVGNRHAGSNWGEELSGWNSQKVSTLLNLPCKISMQLTFEKFLQKRRPLETSMLARFGATPPPPPLTPPLRPAKGCQVEILQMTQSCTQCTGWRRPVGYFILIGHFPQKSPVIGGSFAKLTCNLRQTLKVIQSCMQLQGGEDPWDAWSCRLFFAKEPLIMRLFCGEILKMIQSCMQLQGGKDPHDASICTSFFAKEPLIIGLFGGKWPITIRQPMGLRHPMLSALYLFSIAKLCAYLSLWILVLHGKFCCR